MSRDPKPIRPRSACFSAGKLAPALLALLYLSAGPASAAEQAQVKSEDTSKVRYRGSEFTYRNALTVTTLNPSADLSYNPYYAWSFGFRPNWWFTEKISVHGSLEVTREWTQADDTTYAGEAVLSDLVLGGAWNQLYTIPWVKIALSPEASLTLPFSKASQGRTLVMGLSLGTRLTRGFDLKRFGELTVGYSLGMGPLLHNQTTGELASPTIPACVASALGCDAFLQTGYRNAAFRFRHGASVAYAPKSFLSFSMSLGQILDALYGLSRADVETSYGAEDPSNTRIYSYFELEALARPFSFMDVALGYSLYHAQLAPDSTYYFPFYNRNAALYLDLRFKAENVIRQVRRWAGRED